MSSERLSRRPREGLLSVVSVGFFLVLIGLLFLMTPDLFTKTVTFFSNFNVTSPVPDTSITLPAPDFTRAATNSTVREANLAVYTAAFQFSLAWGVFLVAMLVMRVAAYSSTRRKAENLGDIVFWFGTAYLVQTWLIEKASSTTDAAVQTQRWFEFWPLILMLLGASLIVRAVFLAAVRLSHT